MDTAHSDEVKQKRFPRKWGYLLLIMVIIVVAGGGWVLLSQDPDLYAISRRVGKLDLRNTGYRRFINWISNHEIMYAAMADFNGGYPIIEFYTLDLETGSSRPAANINKLLRSDPLRYRLIDRDTWVSPDGRWMMVSDRAVNSRSIIAVETQGNRKIRLPEAAKSYAVWLPGSDGVGWFDVDKLNPSMLVFVIHPFDESKKRIVTTSPSFSYMGLTTQRITPDMKYLAIQLKSDPMHTPGFVLIDMLKPEPMVRMQWLNAPGQYLRRATAIDPYVKRAAWLLTRDTMNGGSEPSFVERMLSKIVPHKSGKPIDLWISAMDGSNGKKIATTWVDDTLLQGEWPQIMRWSPDGKKLLLITDNEIWVTPVAPN